MNNSFELLVTTLGASSCWVLWFYFIKEQRVDAFREQLFTIRRDLFLLAANGEISFDSRPYIELRYLINGMLRFGHHITFTGSFIATRLSDLDPDKGTVYKRWYLSLDELAPDVRKQLIAIHYRMFRAYMNHLVGGSIILGALGVLYIIRALFLECTSRMFSKKEPGFDVMDVAVNNIANSFDVQALEEQAYRGLSDSHDLLRA
jgi:hypothetical protein